MSTIGHRTTAGPRRVRSPDLAARLIFVTTLPAFLVVASAKRLLPQRLRAVLPGEPKSGAPGSGAPKTILAEAVASARTCMVFASMG